MAVTRAPSQQWTAQQIRTATPFGKGPRFIIRDRDCKFGADFDRAAQALGTRVIKTAVRTPDMNAICERFLGSVRRECLDHESLPKFDHAQCVDGRSAGSFSGIGRDRLRLAGSFRTRSGQRVMDRSCDVLPSILKTYGRRPAGSSYLPARAAYKASRTGMYRSNTSLRRTFSEGVRRPFSTVKSSRINWKAFGFS